MKKLTNLAIVALAALALVTVAFACDKDKAAAANGEKTAAGCQHSDAAKAGCCSHDGDTADAKAAGGCQHAAKTTQMANYKDEAGGCPFHSQATDAQKAALAKGEQVTLVGHVVCASCDLKKAKECKSMFQAENGNLYAIVNNDAFEKLAGETKHGEKKVEIMGTTAKDQSETIVLLSSFKILS